MAIEGMDDLIQRLIHGTRTGKLLWERTANDVVFRLTLDSGMIHIYPVAFGTQEVINEGMGFGLSLLNDDNAQVEVVTAKTDPNLAPQLAELFALARNSALRPSELLQRLRQEIIRRSG